MVDSERGKDFRKERATQDGDRDVEYHSKRDNDLESKIVNEGNHIALQGFIKTIPERSTNWGRRVCQDVGDVDPFQILE